MLVCCVLFVVYGLFFGLCCSLFPVRRLSLFGVRCLLSVAYCLLFVVCCLFGCLLLVVSFLFVPFSPRFFLFFFCSVSLFGVRCLLSVVCCFFFVGCWLLIVGWSLVFVLCGSLFVGCCSMCVV